MAKFKIFRVLDQDIPEKYRERYFALIQQFDEEKYGHIPPSLEYYRIMYALPKEDGKEFKITLLVNEDDFVIGFGMQGWNTKYDQLQSGWMDLYVTPSYRRRGLGNRILKDLVQRFPEEVTTLRAYPREYTPGYFFFQQFKAKPNSESFLVEADLREFNLEDIRKLANEHKENANLNGYIIIFTKNKEFGDNFPLDEFVSLTEEIANAIPRGEISFEKRTHSTERYLMRIERHMKAGYDVISFIATDIKTNQPVGFTTVVINKYYPWQAQQKHTGVTPEHRGMKLGLTLKYQTLLYLLENTEVRFWITNSNKINEHMTRINEILKHKVTGTECGFEFKKDELSKALERI